METKVDNYFSPLTEEEQRLRLKKKNGRKSEKIVRSILWYCQVFYILLSFVTFQWAV